MSLLIKGMDMPVEGLVTVNIHSDGTVYVHGAYPTELHEAVSVPTPHGRLIDADEFRKVVEGMPNCYNGFSDGAQGKRQHSLGSDRLQAAPEDRGRIQDKGPEKDISMKGEMRRCQTEDAENRKKQTKAN